MDWDDISINHYIAVSVFLRKSQRRILGKRRRALRSWRRMSTPHLGMVKEMNQL
jgi:hypothetical protein